MNAYKILLVDDERIIREAIARTVDWERLGLTLIGTAADGHQAWEQIEELRPDIVLTDIKMPRIDGLELIRRTKEHLPDTRFAVLSGYDEFDLAVRAMNHGVKHYLLKPCDEQEIELALSEIIRELDEARRRDKLLAAARQADEARLTEREPLLALLLEEPLVLAPDAAEHLRQAKQLGLKLRLIFVQWETATACQELRVREVAAAQSGADRPLGQSAVAGNRLLASVADAGLAPAVAAAQLLRDELLSRCPGLRLTVAVSDAGPPEALARLYKDAQAYAARVFYLGAGRIATSELAEPARAAGAAPEAARGELVAAALRVGDIDGARQELAAFFQALAAARCDRHTSLSLCLQLMTAMLKDTPPEELLSKTAQLLSLPTLGDIEHCIAGELEIAAQRFEDSSTHKGTAVVMRMKRLIAYYLAHEELSLQWLGQHHLFMNAEYLGRLFRKETNEKFSLYLTRLRIERAKELIATETESKMYEIAERSGFGGDQQYFGNVFKKFTGLSPLEYRKSLSGESR
ncbi:response regulator [Paenibacillus sp. HWE-109]|uniref:response regulator transcription factor n=1 Tax=Paenibacillus sp. HWE-109 TaxID=1306526 RepID=UPI001EDD8500|nr:response regulator [Paenibacillus sp. HWE-109]UKS27066.1 response regulator [Paenibacillus sp. HWE-109]